MPAQDEGAKRASNVKFGDALVASSCLLLLQASIAVLVVLR